MSVFERIGEWFVCKSRLARADALVVLDGAEFELRLATALGLLQKGYALRVLVIQSRYHLGQHAPAREAADARPDAVFLLPCPAVSTREEATEACPLLKRWGCNHVLIVTSWYHTRRALTLFARRLVKHGVSVSAYPVASRDAPLNAWWKSKAGRKTLALEAVKLGMAWLRLDTPFAPGLRFRFKEWLVPTGAHFRPAGALAWVGPQEELTSGLQMHLVQGKLLRGQFSGKESGATGGSGQATQPETPPRLQWARPRRDKYEMDIMKTKTFKAVNITASDKGRPDALAEAFNTWAEKEAPAAIVHVHYYHDQQNRVRGYQVIFEESAQAVVRQMPGEEERRAA
jgi:uncharacterized SAM-binding protein YcdF (DUF218 family)